jgi:uncharacterized protein YdeI (YjbR/CyaY-like superfamily)
MNRLNPKVDLYFSKAQKWQKELTKLRTIILDCQLSEELKWGVPCYSFQKSNIVLIHVFKEYCALLFLNPNNPKPGSQGLKNVCSKFSMGRD